VVLLFFLRSIRSTLVISVSIPISIVTTFALIFFGGFTLNLMTLGGLALGVGMMVDSSIVVLENIFRRRSEKGEAPEEASVEGAREVGTAIIASTLTTLVIFLPLIFVRGVSGILFKELAYVIIFALICSLVVALSLVPMLASRLLTASRQRLKEAGHADEPLGHCRPFHLWVLKAPTWICCAGAWAIVCLPSWRRLPCWAQVCCSCP
jgi:hydrophobic/amphiphilic exporter-1 (mainly G- bacteria), HAE1 family